MIRSILIQGSIADCIKESYGSKYKALELYKTCIDKLSKLVDDQDEYLGTLRNNMADLYLRMKEPYKAIEIYQLAIKALETNGNPIQLANIYSSYGSCYYEIDNYSLALQYYNQAIQLKEEYFGIHHNSLVKVLKNKASLYIKQQTI